MYPVRVAVVIGGLLFGPAMTPIAENEDPGVVQHYGDTGAYTVIRTANNACLATRDIVHELGDGRSEQAVFAFGFGVIHGRLMTLASIMSPAYDMPKRSWQPGHLKVDDSTHPVAFVADDRTLLSAYAPAGLMMRLFDGDRLTFQLPRMTETIPLAGAGATRDLMGQCAHDLMDQAGVNPDGINPLEDGDGADERGTEQSY